MKTITSAVLLAATALTIAPSVSFGQQTTVTAFVVGRDGSPIKLGRSGDCVRTRFWTPSASHPQCKSPDMPAAAQGRRR
jgi:hypothetical protein